MNKAIILITGLTLIGFGSTTGCETLYWADGMKEGETYTINVVGQEELHEACGPGAEACAFPNFPTGCLVYLPANAQSNLVLHELSHCTGRRDVPQSVGH